MREEKKLSQKYMSVKRGEKTPENGSNKRPSKDFRQSTLNYSTDRNKIFRDQK